MQTRRSGLRGQREQSISGQARAFFRYVHPRHSARRGEMRCIGKSAGDARRHASAKMHKTHRETRRPRRAVAEYPIVLMESRYIGGGIAQRSVPPAATMPAANSREADSHYETKLCWILVCRRDAALLKLPSVRHCRQRHRARNKGDVAIDALPQLMTNAYRRIVGDTIIVSARAVKRPRHNAVPSARINIKREAGSSS